MDNLLQIRVEGQPALQRKISLLAQNLDARRLLDEGAAILLYNIKLRYLQMVDAEGTPWPASKAAQRREDTGRGGGTLYDTGRLYGSIQEYAVNDQARAIGTDVPYGKFHNFGAINLPRRQFLAFGQADVETVRNMVLRRITEALNG